MRKKVCLLGRGNVRDRFLHARARHEVLRVERVVSSPNWEGGQTRPRERKLTAECRRRLGAFGRQQADLGPGAQPVTHSKVRSAVLRGLAPDRAEGPERESPLR